MEKSHSCNDQTHSRRIALPSRNTSLFPIVSRWLSPSCSTRLRHSFPLSHWMTVLVYSDWKMTMGCSLRGTWQLWSLCMPRACNYRSCSSLPSDSHTWRWATSWVRCQSLPSWILYWSRVWFCSCQGHMFLRWSDHRLLAWHGQLRSTWHYGPATSCSLSSKIRLHTIKGQLKAHRSCLLTSLEGREVMLSI